jgi:hypothetical protein
MSLATRYSFSKGGLVLAMTAPPRKPPIGRDKTYGEYCFRATCDVFDAETDAEAGRIVGYAKRVSIAEDVEAVCKLVVAKDGTASKKRCGEATMTMLPSSPRTCEGEIFFVVDGVSKKLV